MQFESWLTFCTMALLASATPGPAVLLVSVNSLSVGFKKSLATVLGNISGLFVMLTLSVFGLSTVILHSVIAFTIVKVAGAIYLIYIGLNLWLNGIDNIEPHESARRKSSIFHLYAQGVFVALTNPKVIVFTTALFPHFIVVREPLLPQFSILVMSSMVLSFLCLSLYSIFVQRVRSGTKHIMSGKVLGKILGSTFIGAGCFLAT